MFAKDCTSVAVVRGRGIVGNLCACEDEEMEAKILPPSSLFVNDSPSYFLRGRLR